MRLFGLPIQRFRRSKHAALPWLQIQAMAILSTPFISFHYPSHPSLAVSTCPPISSSSGGWRRLCKVIFAREGPFLEESPLRAPPEKIYGGGDFWERPLLREAPPPQTPSPEE